MGWSEKAFLSSSSSELALGRINFTLRVAAHKDRYWPPFFRLGGPYSVIHFPSGPGYVETGRPCFPAAIRALSQVSSIRRLPGPPFQPSQALTVPGVTYYTAAGTALPPRGGSPRSSWLPGPTCPGPVPPLRGLPR